MSDHTRPIRSDTPPPTAMLQLISGFGVSQAVYIAAELGLADLLHDGPKGSKELAKVTETHAGSLNRVMRALASVGVFGEDSEGRFTLTPVGATLRSDVPGSLREPGHA